MVGCHLSRNPWVATDTRADMGMVDPIPTFSYLIRKIANDYPNLAYLHLVEPRVAGDHERASKDGEVSPVAVDSIACDADHALQD